MAAWLRKGTVETIGILTDYTDPAYVASLSVSLIYSNRTSVVRLTEFCKALIETYLTIPWTETKCGYSCSDQ